MKGEVGPFFFKDGKVLSDSVEINRGEVYGDFRTWGDHSTFWDRLSEIHPELWEMEYFLCPRGRVTYNAVLDKYYVYLNANLNTKKVVDLILQEYDLVDLNYVIDDTDEHYQIVD